jgi:hypothetical protein
MGLSDDVGCEWMQPIEFGIIHAAQGESSRRRSILVRAFNGGVPQPYLLDLPAPGAAMTSLPLYETTISEWATQAPRGQQIL